VFLPEFHERPDTGGFYSAGEFLLDPETNAVKLREALQQTAIQSYRASATSLEAVREDKLRIDKTVNLAQKWAKLPEAERNKALTDLTRGAPPRYKEIVASYFSNLNQAEALKQPQVWHRDGQRPTFARVYLGGGNSLDLVSLQVSVTIEGPRARTV